jgi:DNA-directed RNA polymerase subunit alpha
MHLQEEGSIEELGLNTRITLTLQRQGIKTLDQLCDYTPWELLELRNVGHTTLRYIEEDLAKLGRSLKEK